MRLIVALPILWFALVGMTVVFSGYLGGGGGSDLDGGFHVGAHPDGRVGRSLGANSDDKDGGGEGLKSAARQPAPPPDPAGVVIERPEPDRLRFEAQMQADMEKELRKKSRRRHNHPDMPDELPDHIMHQLPIPGNHDDQQHGGAVGKSSSTSSKPHDPNGPGKLVAVLSMFVVYDEVPFHA